MTFEITDICIQIHKLKAILETSWDENETTPQEILVASKELDELVVRP
jgi:hypothetical protein